MSLAVDTTPGTLSAPAIAAKNMAVSAKPEGNVIADYLGITNDIGCLPFVRKRKSKPTDFWSVRNLSDADAARMADMLVLFMAKDRFSFTLGHVVEAMIEHGKFGPAEVIFLSRVAEYAMRGICMKPEHIPRFLRD